MVNAKNALTITKSHRIEENAHQFHVLVIHTLQLMEIVSHVQTIQE